MADIKREIMHRVESLPPDLQRKVLAYCDALEQPSVPGVSGKSLERFMGTLDDASAREMIEAIEEGCEGIDHREW